MNTVFTFVFPSSSTPTPPHTSTPPHTHTQRKHTNIAQSYSYGSLNMDRVAAAIIQLDQKLIWIPVVFILLRLPGTIRFFISFHPSCHKHLPGCDTITTTDECNKYLYDNPLVLFQSIGDPGQGWGNAILFIVFNRVIARRLCPCVFALWRKLKKRFCKRHARIPTSEEPVSAHDPLLRSVSSSSKGSPVNARSYEATLFESKKTTSS